MEENFGCGSSVTFNPEIRPVLVQSVIKKQLYSEHGNSRWDAKTRWRNLVA